MKGISPIVAAVLLIAITMTIAGVLAYWSSTFVERSLPVENATTSECRFAQFEFISCKYNSTAQSLTFSLNNVRNTELKNLTAYVEYNNGTILPSGGYALNESLPGGKIGIYSISNVGSDFSKLLIKTHCPELSRSSTCTG